MRLSSVSIPHPTAPNIVILQEIDRNPNIKLLVFSRTIWPACRYHGRPLAL